MGGHEQLFTCLDRLTLLVSAKESNHEALVWTILDHTYQNISMKIHGSCHCQAIRYEVDSNRPYPYQKCYCSICRKTSGGEGYRALMSPDGRQSNHHHRFCRHCGSHLWAWNKAWPELLHPVASSVDSALPKSPYYTHIMLKYKPDWIETFVSTDDLCFGEYPNESIAEWHERLEYS